MSRRVRLFSGDFDLQVQISWRISFFDFFCSVQSIELVVLKYFSGAESSQEFAELICVVNKFDTFLRNLVIFKNNRTLDTESIFVCTLHIFLFNHVLRQQFSRAMN